MKTQITSFILAGIMFSTAASSQITFQKTYNVNSNSFSMYASTTTPDSGVVIVGMIDFLSSPRTSMFLTKVDKYGDVSWTRLLNNSNDHVIAYGIYAAGDGTLIISGAAVIGQDLYAVLIKTDSVGNIIWNRNLGMNWSATRAIPTLDGGYMVTGNSTVPGSLGPCMYKTDSNGNLQWGKEAFLAIAAGYTDKVIAVQNSDSSYTFLCGTSSFGPPYAFYLFQLSSSGNMNWAKSFGPYDISTTSLIKTSDGGYLLSGMVNTISTIDCYTVKTDGTGNIMWSKIFGGAGFDILMTAVQTTDNGFAFFGSSNSFPVFLGIPHDGYLVKMDTAGNLQWSKSFGTAPHGEAIIEGMYAMDGGFFLCGVIGYNPSGNEELYLIKTDSSGTSGCDEYISNTNVIAAAATNITQVYSDSSFINPQPISIISVPHNVFLSSGCFPLSVSEYENNSAVTIFPNPAGFEVTIVIDKLYPGTSLKLCSADGRVVKESKLTGLMTPLNVSDLPPGLYLATIRSGILNENRKVQISR